MTPSRSFFFGFAQTKNQGNRKEATANSDFLFRHEKVLPAVAPFLSTARVDSIVAGCLITRTGSSQHRAPLFLAGKVGADDQHKRNQKKRKSHKETPLFSFFCLLNGERKKKKLETARIKKRKIRGFWKR
ncbi:hypothetical protein [Pandoravirus japonicus]|uniref:Uncharacterized protein n=1 Tax=Pandoravirus japonicus TaxID=2823154 RepID=A0A811BN41_9VIRU|nr:hypothetical protein [Pandoravirus japonicus]